MDDADDVVEAATADREARVVVLGHLLQVFFLRVFDVEVDHVTAGHHQRGDLPLVEAEDVAHHFVLALLDGAGFGTFGQQGMDFFLGDLVHGIRIDAHAAQDEVGRTGQRHHEWPRDERQQAHGAGGQARDGFGADLAQPLGHQLADEDGDIGDQHDHERGGQPFGRAFRETQRDHPAGQWFGKGRLTDDPVEDADGGDADLDGGEKACRVFAQGEGCSRRPVTFGRLAAQPGLAGREQRHFRHGKETVEYDQAQQQGSVHQCLRDACVEMTSMPTEVRPLAAALARRAVPPPAQTVTRGLLPSVASSRAAREAGRGEEKRTGMPLRWRDGGSVSEIIDADWQGAHAGRRGRASGAMLHPGMAVEARDYNCRLPADEMSPCRQRVVTGSASA